jgi:hypothetical protein
MPRNLKSENSQDYAQKPQRNCMFMNSASGLYRIQYVSSCRVELRFGWKENMYVYRLCNGHFHKNRNINETEVVHVCTYISGVYCAYLYSIHTLYTIHVCIY